MSLSRVFTFKEDKTERWFAKISFLVNEVCWYVLLDVESSRSSSFLRQLKVPHEVKNQRAIAKRTSQMMQIGQDVIIQMERCIISKMGNGTRCSR